MTTVISFNSFIVGLAGNVIRIDSASMGKVLADYVIQGSGKNILEARNVVIHLQDDQDEGSDIEGTELLRNGTSLFAAVIYLNADAATRANFTYAPAGNEDVVWTSTKTAQYIFAAYFYILTQNKAINLVEKDSSFIKTTIGLTESVRDVGEALFEGGMEKIPHDWVRSIALPNLAQESRNRLGLGIAGYRLPQAFLSVRIKDSAPDVAKNAWKAIQKYVMSGYYWDMHTNFRSPEFIIKFKSINKIMSSLLAEHGDDSDLANAKNKRIIYELPTMDLRYNNYDVFTDENFNLFKTQPIFPQPERPVVNGQ